MRKLNFSMLQEKLACINSMPEFRSELIVLGLGGTVDYEIKWDNSVFQGLIDSFQIRLSEIATSEVITTERELVCNILAYLKNSAGGERQLDNSEIVKIFSNRFEKKITLGGTGVRAAICMRKFGITSTLHLVSIDDYVRKLLPRDCPYICSSDVDTLDPHLIVQFSEKTSLYVEGIHISPSRADRIIITCDPPNEILELSAKLTETLKKAKIFLISGFNSIHNESLLKLRLNEIEEYSESLPEGSYVFFEDAGYHRPEFRPIVMERMARLSTFFSINEEELQGYLQRDVDFQDEASIVSAVHDISKRISVPILMIHTKYWSIVVGSNHVRYVDSLLSGITMATTRYIFGDDFTVEDFVSTGQLSKNQRSLEMADSINNQLANFGHFIPAFNAVCESPTTIGLGDSFVGGFILGLINDFI